MYPKYIMEFLSNFSHTNSFGIPVGGPAARLLSELTANQVDRLLLSIGMKFARFADDYHIFVNSRDDAYRSLIFISDKLYTNQGISLQKSKTRITSSAEFRTTSPIKEEEVTEFPNGEEDFDTTAPESVKLIRFSLHFDPYSATAQADYARLRDEVRRFDIVNLMKNELNKSCVHIALARKIVAAVRYLDLDDRSGAVISIIESANLLYPIMSSVLLMINSVFDELSEDAKETVVASLVALIRADFHVFRVDIHLAYAIRVLSKRRNLDTQMIVQQLYEQRVSPLIRRDAIITMANWGEWWWLSDLKE